MRASSSTVRRSLPTALALGLLLVFSQTLIAHAETSPAGSQPAPSPAGTSNIANSEPAGSQTDPDEAESELEESEASESETGSEAPEASEGSDPETESEGADDAESDASEEAEAGTGSEDPETRSEDAETPSEVPAESAPPPTSEAPPSEVPDAPVSSDGGGAGDGNEPTHPQTSVQPPQRHDRSADVQVTVTAGPSALSWHPDPTWGAYSTAGLVRVADRLQRQGWTRADIARRVFAPFPVEGLAAWSDTWGAPRYAGGYHPHHGQDLLCAEGTPLVAVQPGTVQFHADPLGGTTIFLLRGDGSFWYYAHLSAYAHSLQSGASVERGQVIGFCGATGDATISHLHFALFDAAGNAIDPMPYLLRWLHVAEHRSDLRASTGRGVSIPDTNSSESGEGPPAVPFLAHAAEAESGAGATMVAPIAAPQLSVRPEPGVHRGVVAAVTMLLLPLPLVSRRVRRRVLRSVR